MVVCRTLTKVISALSSSVLTSAQDMMRESPISYTNRMILTADRQTHPLDLSLFHNLGIGSPDPRPLTTGVHLLLPVKYTMNITTELLSVLFS